MPALRIPLGILLLAALLTAPRSAAHPNRFDPPPGNPYSSPATAHTEVSPQATGLTADPFDDVFVGVPLEDIDTISNAGSVNAFYGTPTGLSPISDWLWDQDDTGIADNPEDGDRFGDALATGDFNGDGCMDVAIGAPSEDGAAAIAGAVHVLYGAASGISSVGSQFLVQGVDGMLGTQGVNDFFGYSLAGGDFNRDGYTDLAIGVRGDMVNSVGDAGAVAVLPGSPAGLDTTHNDLFTQNHVIAGGNPAELGDHFGSSLAVGDFNGDSFVDLAIGVMHEDIDTHPNAGVVDILFGSNAGLVPYTGMEISQDGSEFWEDPGAEDWFGSEVAAGDFNADGYSDLVVGVSHEDFDHQQDSGYVQVFPGSPSGPSPLNQLAINQGSPGMSEIVEPFDALGDSLAVGDFNHDGYMDLAMGAPGESYGLIDNAGVVHILYGSANGLTSRGSQLYAQNMDYVQGPPENQDYFGKELAAGQINQDEAFDLVIGAPGDKIGTEDGAGGMQILFGSAGGLTTTSAQYWSQDTYGIDGIPEYLDYFGDALATTYCPGCRYPIYLPFAIR